MEQIKRLPLNALKYFYFVGRYSSLSVAAEKLCVTHSAVSKQLKLLESYFEEPLLLKHGRGIQLSRTGKILYEHCHDAFSCLEKGLTEIQHQQKQHLVISCEPTLAMKWLIPRMAEFQAKHPFQIVILAAGGQVDFRQYGIDIALRRNDFHWSPTLYTEKIAEEQMGVVQMPNLTLHQKLHTRTRPNAWQHWGAQTGIEFKHYSDVFFERFALAIQGAVSGIGLTVASKLMVEHELKQGSLIAPYGFIPDGSAYYLLSETDFNTDYKKQQFLAWVKAEIALTLAK